MNWDLGQPDLTEHDTSNFSFYNEQECAIIRKVGSVDEPPTVRMVKGKIEWDTWIQDEQDVIDSPECSYVVLCRRDEEIFPGQPSPVSHLPFGRNVWNGLARLLRVDRSITRVIARNVAHFSSVRRSGKDGNEERISYSARMSTSQPDDLALSTTYITSTGSTYSVVYGCNPSQMKSIERRLQSAGSYMSHPLLLAGIFAELERERLIAAADDLVDKFALYSNFTDNTKLEPNSSQIGDYFGICVKSRNLVDQVRAVKRQLVSFVDELDVLEQQWRPEIHSMPLDAEDMRKKAQIQNALETGGRIKRRLAEIAVEYDDKIDECEMIAQNLPLAMQTVWNQTSRQEFLINTRIAKANNVIALETKRESTQMRSIALLTMVYLPMSCVASIFSTSLFNWSAAEGEPVVSGYIWILVVLSIALTIVTMLAWHFATNRDRNRENKRKDIELGEMG